MSETVTAYAMSERAGTGSPALDHILEGGSPPDALTGIPRASATEDAA